MKNTVTFQQFWDAYGLKKDRMGANNAWKRLSAKDKAAAFAGIKAYREDCQRTNYNMMYAVRYLNHRRWEDEISAEEQPSAAQPTPEKKPSVPQEMDLW